MTNITYNNTTIVNQGPNYDELRQRTRQPIQRLRLERRQRFGHENPQTIVRGDVIEMSAPAIAPAQQSGRPRVVKEKIAQAVVDRDWTEVRDKKAAQEARAKMKAEATPPSGAPAAKATQAQTPEPAQPTETPVRNFPDRAKIKPRPSATVAPGIIATPPRPRQETKDATRQMKEAERAQKEKMRADEKAAEQQKAERLRKAKASKNQPPSPTPAVSVSPRATPVAKPLPKATVAKPSPATSAAPRTTPVVKQRPAQTPPASAKRPVSLAPAASAAPTKPNSSPPNRAGEKKNEKDKKKKGERGKPSPSPSSAQQP